MLRLRLDDGDLILFSRHDGNAEKSCTDFKAASPFKVCSRVVDEGDN